jgi:tetratricopeptide (TPR) repeat protein
VVGFNPYAGQGGVEGLQLLEEALTRLPAGDSTLRVWLLARLGIDPYMLSLYFGGQIAWADQQERLVRERADEAVAMARRLGDRPTLAFALVMRGLRTLLHSEDERLADAGEIIGMTSETQNPDLLLQGVFIRHIALIDQGEFAGARAVEDDAKRILERVPIPYFVWRATVAKAGWALSEGRFDDAERWIDEADRIQPVSNVGTRQRVTLCRERGQVDQLLGLFERFGALEAAAPLSAPYMLVYLLDIGRLDKAREYFDGPGDEKFFSLIKHVQGLGYLADAVTTLHDVGRAGPVYERLLPHADRYVIGDAGDNVGLPVSYQLGRLAALLRRWDEAECHFADSLRLCEHWGFRLWVAWTRFAWADTLVKRGEPADRERSLELVNAALADAEQIGMKRLAEQALALKVQVQGILKA